MDQNEIDHAILCVASGAQGRWVKVAMVIAKASMALTNRLPEGDDGGQDIATRIEKLVSEGQLVGRGDLKNWRFSEVRTP